MNHSFFAVAVVSLSGFRVVNSYPLSPYGVKEAKNFLDARKGIPLAADEKAMFMVEFMVGSFPNGEGKWHRVFFSNENVMSYEDVYNLTRLSAILIRDGRLIRLEMHPDRRYYYTVGDHKHHIACISLSSSFSLPFPWFEPGEWHPFERRDVDILVSPGFPLSEAGGMLIQDEPNN